MAKRSWHMCSVCGTKIHKWDSRTTCIACERKQARQARRRASKEARAAG